MTREFDLAASLAGGVQGRSGAWTFIQDFAAHWVGAALSSDDGWTEADLDAAEARLGLRLPTALREAYLLFGRRQDLTSNHDALLGPAQLHVDRAGEALVFRHENQGAASWGILLGSLQDADEDLCDFFDPDDDSVETLEANSVQLPLPVYPIGEKENGTRWFLGQDVLLRHDGGMAILARGRTAGDLDRVRDLIPGDWLDDCR
ncbi:SMI1/KNR4 family protein [Streptomyces cinerochromogenes]|uniref:SMI1/KNR4 family protein n=1 Tax=Streptomyces cinerochromogenes TaxID=66422 RepID=UPI0036AA2554